MVRQDVDHGISLGIRVFLTHTCYTEDAEHISETWPHQKCLRLVDSMLEMPPFLDHHYYTCAHSCQLSLLLSFDRESLSLYNGTLAVMSHLLE